MLKVGGQQVCLILALALASLASAQGPTHSLKGLIDQVLRLGPDSELPAHLSMVLGINAGEAKTPVKQAVARSGDSVRTFNVSTAHHNVVVLMNYNERTHVTRAYLVSAAGQLRKSIAYQPEAPAVEQPADVAGKEFVNESKFWEDFERQAAKPK